MRPLNKPPSETFSSFIQYNPDGAIVPTQCKALTHNDSLMGLHRPTLYDTPSYPKGKRKISPKTEREKLEEPDGVLPSVLLRRATGADM